MTKPGTIAKWGILIALLSLAAFAVFMYLGWRVLDFVVPRSGPQVGGTQLPSLPPALSLEDTLTIWLALLGLMVAISSLIVTGAGIMLGILAVFGYVTFKEEVGKKASRAGAAAGAKAGGTAASKRAEEFFRGKDFDDKLKQGLLTWGSGTVTGPASTYEALADQYPKDANQQ